MGGRLTRKKFERLGGILVEKKLLVLADPLSKRLPQDVVETFPDTLAEVTGY